MILKTNSEVGTPKCIQFPEGWIVKPLQELTHCSFGGGTPSTTNPCFWNGPIGHRLRLDLNTVLWF